jgi:oligopeptide/dipeptide ABC transporter ATP-binding protein
VTAIAAAAPDVVTSGQPLLQVRDLAVHFRISKGLLFSRYAGTVRAVDGVSFDIERGQTVGLVGESGCGKSTTGRAIARLNRPTAGSIRLDGQELSGLDGAALRRVRRRLQMIFQDPYSSLNPRMTIGAIVREPLDIHSVGSARERADRVGQLLDVVGLSRQAADRYPHQFSGGQRQRVGIARALALNPELIVADEPISALDVSIQAQILNLLARLQRDFKLTYLFIAHDLAAVRHISDRVLVMYLGRIVESASSTELYRRPLHPYTVALLSAVPVPDPAAEATRRRIVLKGDVPSPAAPPSGCAFHTRCWLRERLGNPGECTAVAPPLRALAGRHTVACHFAETLEDAPVSAAAAATATPGAHRPGD